MSESRSIADLWGRIVLDHHLGLAKTYYAIRERRGELSRGHSIEVYFAPPERSFPWEQEILDALAGPLLDLGAGPGRVALWAQAENLPVVAIDASPLTVLVAVERGVRDVRLGHWEALEEVLLPTERDFGSVALMGHNLGLGGTRAGLRRLLALLAQRVRPGGALIATSRDPTDADRTGLSAALDPPTRQERGLGNPRAPAVAAAPDRYPGELVVRVEYDGSVGPYFPWLLIDSEELGRISASVGWQIERLIFGERADYGVVLRRIG
jgi:SAM-dependent methyltransferase